MVEKRMGFGPSPKKIQTEGDIFVAGEDLASIKKVLEDSLEETRKKEGSVENDTNIDLTKNLINQLDGASAIINLLNTAVNLGLVVPGQKEFESEKKRKLGFTVPEPTSEESQPPKS